MLSDLEIKRAKPQQKSYKLTDKEGLYIEVLPSGAKSFRLKYRFGGIEKRLTFGLYPVISLQMARELATEAKRSVINGIDPALTKKSTKARQRVGGNESLTAIAKSWHASRKKIWTAGHAGRVWARLDNNVLPWIGERRISEITAIDVLACLKRVEDRGSAYMAKRTLNTLAEVYEYAIAQTLCDRSPCVGIDKALAKTTTRHMAAVTTPEALAGLLKSMDAFKGTFPVKIAMTLAPHLFMRPVELRKLQWSWIDFDAQMISIPAEMMKSRRPHLVPMSSQVIELLREIKPLTGHLEYVFPSARDPKRPMSEAAINAALKRLGIDTQAEQTGHGFRATARTLIREKLKIDSEVIECQLAHAKAGSLGGAYDRTQFLDERVAMMQAWSDYIDILKAKK